MFHFDTEIPNTISFILLWVLLAGSFYRTATHHYNHAGMDLVWGIRNITWSFIVGLGWWMLAHHGNPVDPGSDSFWQLYKGPMRAYCAIHIWVGFRYSLKGFGVRDELMLTGIPCLAAAIALFTSLYIGAC